MTADNRLLLDAQLCFALYAASNAMTRLYRDRLEPLGLTYPQYLVLLVLWEHDDLTVSQLGERLYLDSGTLTPLLKRMEAAGHISRRRDPADERQVRIGLTPAGQALKASVAEMHAGLACLLPLEPDHLARLRTELRDFAASLNDRTAE
ncbi:MarR family transcriptional regulator [Ferrovibrio sp.]|uniref:MarR family winged helix-turn-helix transcriptional regulator n=1 Tax=Ferrovibrio sp. TaxID=1917215 RepID=UPI0025C2CC0A|nr:MarR family transcriptional regulator [Ferrovibrio sp.]MBX3455014.1 MarR family transcriptional regulator [Ferrovibrio sp.]